MTTLHCISKHPVVFAIFFNYANFLILLYLSYVFCFSNVRFSITSGLIFRSNKRIFLSIQSLRKTEVITLYLHWGLKIPRNGEIIVKMILFSGVIYIKYPKNYFHSRFLENRKYFSKFQSLNDYKPTKFGRKVSELIIDF